MSLVLMFLLVLYVCRFCRPIGCLHSSFCFFSSRFQPTQIDRRTASHSFIHFHFVQLNLPLPFLSFTFPFLLLSLFSLSYVSLTTDISVKTSLFISRKCKTISHCPIKHLAKKPVLNFPAHPQTKPNKELISPCPMFIESMLS
jgi:hypothetical protein